MASTLPPLIPTNHILTSGENNALTWTNALTVNSIHYSSLVGSTVSTDVIMTSSIQTNTVQYSTIQASTINYGSFNVSTIVASTMGIGTTTAQYPMDVRGSTYLSTLIAPTDLLAQAPYLTPSAANRDMIIAWLQKIVNTVTPVPGVSPFWASSGTFGTIATSVSIIWTSFGAFTGGVLLPDGRVIFVPSFVTSICIFDPLTNTCSTGGITPAPVSMFSPFYNGGVLLPDGRVVFVPHAGNSIGIFNPFTNTYGEVLNITSSGRSRGGVLLPDGRVIFIPTQTNPAIGIYDPVGNTYTTLTMSPAPGGNAYNGGVLLPDGRVVLVPYFATTIGIFTPGMGGSADTYTTVPNATAPGGSGFSGAYSGGVLLPDGRVVFVPSSSSTIGIFNPATNAFTTVSVTTNNNGAYSSGVLLPDGRVLFVPFNMTSIGIFNPITLAFTTVASTPGNNAYQGGVLIPDGRIIFVPYYGVLTIGVFNTNLPAPREFCLHPFFNKF